jgi:hypothetical protein
MAATRVDFGKGGVPACAQGEDFDRLLTYKDPAGNPIDLTGSTAKMIVRDTYGGAPVLTFDSADGSIVLGGAAGTIRLKKPAAEINAVQVPNTGVRGSTVPAQVELVHDLVVWSAGGIPSRLIEGVFIVTATSTR